MRYASKSHRKECIVKGVKLRTCKCKADVGTRLIYQVANLLRDLSKREKVFYRTYALENVEEHFGW